MRQLIVSTARSWLGTRFHHQGRLKGVGCDCAGLVVGVCRELLIDVADKTDYTRQPDGVMMRQTCEQNMTEIAPTQITPGDVLLFRFDQHPQHVAIVGNYDHGGLSIIHAYAPSRKVIETRLDDVWMSRIVAAYRLPGVM
jgi:NlpC/P60 family putative phage cell wall peptidase